MELYQQLQQKPFLIAGPCVIESEELVLQIAHYLKDLQEKYKNFVIVFKASFDKANRTAIDSYRGPGLEKGLEILQKVKEQIGLPILTDIHEANQAQKIAAVADIIQIPAFLCRQTDLLLATANTQKIVNVKKAQFLSPADMVHVLGKIESTQNHKILLTERGTMFGFNNLIVDYTGLLDMQDYGYPVVMDATHSVQKPGAANGKSGGNSKYAPYLAKAAAAIGVKGFFIETHPQPLQALSDGPNMIPLDEMPKLLNHLNKIIQLDIH